MEEEIDPEMYLDKVHKYLFIRGTVEEIKSLEKSVFENAKEYPSELPPDPEGLIVVPRFTGVLHREGIMYRVPQMDQEEFERKIQSQIDHRTLLTEILAKRLQINDDMPSRLISIGYDSQTYSLQMVREFFGNRNRRIAYHEEKSFPDFTQKDTTMFERFVEELKEIRADKTKSQEVKLREAITLHETLLEDLEFTQQKYGLTQGEFCQKYMVKLVKKRLEE
jgi:hypothetical protein